MASVAGSKGGIRNTALKTRLQKLRRDAKNASVVAKQAIGRENKCGKS